MRSGAGGRGLPLAISFLLVCVAGGEAGHALAGLEGHGLGLSVLATQAMFGVSDSAPPHGATNCLLCRAARVSRVTLDTIATYTPAVAGECSAMALPEASAPLRSWGRVEDARAPPVRLVV